ncbi:hypothetical protein [Streptomyces flavofungini]|uniref:Uncharacterized protein n=1 Tax=Streptomyces flavofungini TaxID=68200 RepID=A0ABS0XA48_9ACTN|nr:hypothetical protein [Streptomyces flavofungini]MBJ3809896.1 hypothetical protein [Streptomyces flavofungini]GHC54249.1 hypothetical protein GCM10010349_20720 [Streptomyces flavofungini]
MSGREYALGPGRTPRPRQGFPAAGAAPRAVPLGGAPCLLIALLCLVLALGPAYALIPGDVGEERQGPSATTSFGPPVDVRESRSEAGESGCHGGGGRETPRAAALPVPEHPSTPEQRADSPRHDPGQGIVPLGGTSSPDVTAVDLYRTCVIRT